MGFGHWERPPYSKEKKELSASAKLYISTNYTTQLAYLDLVDRQFRISKNTLN